MRKIAMTLAAAALVLGTVRLANAQTQGASSLNTQAQNATAALWMIAACGAVGARRVVTGFAARIVAGALPAGNYWPNLIAQLRQWLKVK